MTTKDLLDYHETVCNQSRSLMAKKNHDYSGSSGDTPFANFECGEHLGIGTTEQGILFRLTDKLKRLIEFSKTGDFKVTDEKVDDTVQDAINYTIILGARLKDKQPKLNNGNTTNSSISRNL